ncbi:uncharacterized protein (DUF305 family) [Crossiella equi]|uniref:Uncharacterized protein (DUF305 family) n=1 Tax=Crossiella equi TaxID=130796 RepID=A0ABS5AJG2_9PSEU|nr:DUF305 domain-containing protein [Crossiella equi]MBP2476711.1 uncharacterized protein (DUF305 family) [Crossiella equi]
MRHHKLVLTGLGVLTALVLAACGGGSPSAGHTDGHADGHAGHGGTSASVQPGADHNAADIAFAQGMIPHHQQALDMSKLASGRTQNQKVLDLAKRIQAGQQPEIDKMTGWLKSWNAPVKPEGDGGHAGHGMMSGQQMNDLLVAKDAAFDQKFLTMMIEHHRGAVDSARTELAQGKSAEAKHLAEEVIKAQEQEIGEMTALLKG